MTLITSDDLASLVQPRILTELPGPNARRVIERDERVTSPSLTRVYPLVVRRGAGCIIEDVDGNRFLDFNAGIAVTAAGHAHPEGERRDPRPGRRGPALLLQRLLPTRLRRDLRAPGRQRADAAGEGVPGQLGNGGRRRRDQAGSPLHRAAERDRVLRRLPRSLARQPVADRVEGPSSAADSAA